MQSKRRRGSRRRCLLLIVNLSRFYIILLLDRILILRVYRSKWLRILNTFYRFVGTGVLDCPLGKALASRKHTNSEFIAMIADNLRLKYKLY